MAGRGWWTGRREAERYRAIARLLRPGDVVWDVGAHHGYVSLLAAAAVGSTGRVYAFEPSARNLWYLRRHLDWNGVRAVDVVPTALADREGIEAFGGGGSSTSFRLGAPGAPVSVTSVSRAIESGMRPPTFLKIDAEGAEARVLQGARSVLEAAARAGSLPTILVSVHSARLYRECLGIVKASYSTVLACTRLAAWLRGESTKWPGDPDLLAHPPEREEQLAEIEELRWFSGGVRL